MHEDGVDGLEIEFGGQVHHREIFVIEIAMLFRRIAVAFDEMVEHVEMGVDVAVEIHRHEAGKLQEARIDLAARRPDRGRARHGCNCWRNHCGPRFSASLLTAVGLRRVSIGPPLSVIDAGTCGLVLGLHPRHRRQHRDGGLADREQVERRAARDARGIRTSR